MPKKYFFNNLAYWTVVGTNYTVADAKIRSRFAITQLAIEKIYARVYSKGLRDFLVLSTCNRIEFYGCTSVDTVQRLVQEELNLTAHEWCSYFYSKSGVDAARHFFRVTAGLDSQIVGDYEISGQVKKAIQNARDSGLVSSITDRISNYALQASKEIKRKTNLSNGKYSVSYATAELITSLQVEKPDKKILIVGTGSIGRAMARNLIEYFPQGNLTLTNRTLDKAWSLAEELNVSVIPFESFITHLPDFDVIITTVESDCYLITPQHIQKGRGQLFLDLSVPQVIDPRIKNDPSTIHFSVDEISDFHNKLIQLRNFEIPKAIQIIEEFIAELLAWQILFKNTEVVQNYKKKVGRMLLHRANKESKIEKEFSGLMKKIKLDGYTGCSVIQTVNELIESEK
jgi:glutamyl-tRNA reductase